MAWAAISYDGGESAEAIYIAMKWRHVARVPVSSPVGCYDQLYQRLALTYLAVSGDAQGQEDSRREDAGASPGHNAR